MVCISTDPDRLDNASYTTSITSSVLDYQYVNVTEIFVQWLLIIADMKCVTTLFDHGSRTVLIRYRTVADIIHIMKGNTFWYMTLSTITLCLSLMSKQPNDEREQDRLDLVSSHLLILMTQKF